MRYVDGYVLPVPKKNLQAYRLHRAEGGQNMAGARRPRVRECVGVTSICP